MWLAAGRPSLGFDLPEEPPLFVAHALGGDECLLLLDWRAVIECAVVPHHTLVTDAKDGGDHALHAHPRTYRRQMRGLEAPFVEGGPRQRLKRARGQAPAKSSPSSRAVFELHPHGREVSLNHRRPSVIRAQHCHFHCHLTRSAPLGNGKTKPNPR